MRVNDVHLDLKVILDGVERERKRFPGMHSIRYPVQARDGSWFDIVFNTTGVPA